MVTDIVNPTPVGANEERTVLGNIANNTVAQPLTDGGETNPRKGERVTVSNGKENETGEHIDDASVDEQASGSVNARLEVDKPKKKKKKGGKSKRGPTALTRDRGTGFEDFFCDPPMTPAEVEEEKNEIYPADRPFVDRIEECIQRYRARRRLDNTRANLFNKFLALGGVDTTPRMFQGMKSMDVEGATNNEIRDMIAGDVIHRGGGDARYYNDSESEQWDVDFAGVVAGFFSERIFKVAGTDVEVIQIAARLVENFLNYVLHHDVCPEYADNVKQAKDICNEAVDQITRCFKLIWDGVGDFNIACQTLFDTGKRKVFDPDSIRNPLDMPRDQATRIFFTSLGAHDSIFSKFMGVDPQRLGDIEVVDEVKQTFEVVEICEPTEEQMSCYLGVLNAASQTGEVKPCGVLTVKPVSIEDGWDRGCVSGPAEGIGPLEQFFLEWDIMKTLTVGMKLKLAVCFLSVDFKYIKAFLDVRPRYYKFIAQELMVNYKEPVPNERPAPSAENPGGAVEGDEGGEGNMDE